MAIIAPTIEAAASAARPEAGITMIRFRLAHMRFFCDHQALASPRPRWRALASCIVALALGAGVTDAAQAASVKAIWGPAIHDGASLFPTYRDLGVKIYEDRLDWAQIAPRRPGHPRNPDDRAYQWPAEVTRAVAEAKRYHMQVALQIIGAPTWANGGRPWNWAPKNPRDYANFAIAAARRFPSVHLWMIWGEPSRTHNFEPETPAKPFAKLDARQKVAPHIYARLLEAAYGALKSVSRSNLVIGGMTYTTGDISTQQWIENLRLPSGRRPRLDMYGDDPFSFRAPSLANPPSPDQQIDFSDQGRLSKLVDRYLGRPGNPDPKLFISEWTVPTKVDLEFDFYVEPLVQAQWIADGLRVASELPSVYAVGWIHLYDEPPESYGGLIEADGTKKPGYFAWKRG
ncbi:MAG: hypothetical protein ACYCU0_04845 [Solirubrobacteraceae bacterium]